MKQGLLQNSLEIKYQKKDNTSIHSVSIFGPNYKEIPDHNCKSSFGVGSTWEWLSNNKNVCNLSMGIGLNGGATICHYPEQKHKVDYRYFKFFETKIIDKKIISLRENIHIILV